MKSKLGLIAAIVLIVGVVLFSRGGMFAVVYAPEILLAQPEKCPKAVLTNFPPPIRTAGVLVDDSAGLQALGAGASWDIDNLRAALQVSNLSFLEIHTSERVRDWMSLADSLPGGYIRVSWSTLDDPRCKQYEDYLRLNSTEPPKPRCLALEAEAAPSSDYEISTSKADPSDQFSWEWRLIELRTGKLYATQPLGGDSQLSRDCRELAQTLNRQRFTALIKQ